MNDNIKKVLKNIEDGKKRTIWFDIDGTLASTESDKYDRAEPDEAMIILANMLYDEGHTIFLVTARGATSGIDWRETTEKQLKEWGVKYHKLIMGYPRDLIIDDASIRPDEFLNII
ncbi:hypothetical protein MBGDN05_00071 [Thermoplasmatales archaeon SCGC AB-539-N05]|nr:hypothetical protein MBGDN05_00071 [Thermoplasmatales archaeon SCGC AB-539-N05]